MCSKTLITVDPGISTGITVGTFSDTEPYRRTHAFQVEGGLSVIKRFLHTYVNTNDTSDHYDYRWLSLGTGKPGFGKFFRYDDEFVVVAEKFTPRSGQGFSHTLKSVEPLRIEGALVYADLLPDYQAGKPNPQWQQPAEQYFCGGSGVTEKRKRSKAFLKKHGLYLTGKDVGCKDAEDAISATLHALTYMRKINHVPTLKEYFS